MSVTTNPSATGMGVAAQDIVGVINNSLIDGLTNADIAANAAIAKSKLAVLGIVDADVAANAAIALSKLAAGALTGITDLTMSGALAGATSHTIEGVGAGVLWTAKRDGGANGSLTLAFPSQEATLDSVASDMVLKVAGTERLRLDAAGAHALAGDFAVSGAVSVGNTVNSVSPTAPNRTITMVVGGTTYYLHAKTTND